MNRMGIVGRVWHMGGTDALVPFTIPVDERASRIVQLADAIQVSELVYLATCNRVEIILVGDGQTSMDTYRDRIFEHLTDRRSVDGDARRVMRAWGGEGAAEHLFMVASGLDSAQLGETEILGQTQSAYELARGLGLAGPRLKRLFQSAVRTARKIHRTTGIGKGKVSLSTIALKKLRRGLEQRPGMVALMGISDMTRNCGRDLQKEGIATLVVNRTLSGAEELARQIGAESCSLEEFRRCPPKLAAILTATGGGGAGEPILREKDLKRIALAAGSAVPLIVDMGVPPNVLPEEASAAGFQRVGMDEIVSAALSGREGRVAEVARARECVDRALHDLRKSMAERMVAPVIVDLRERYRRQAKRDVETLLRRKLPELSESDQRVLREWADSLARRLAHIPLTGLRSLAVERGLESVEAFAGGADIGLVREVYETIDRTGDPPSPDEVS